jgi:ATP-dependent DNA ligase
MTDYSRAKYKDSSISDWKTLKSPVASIKYDGAHDYVIVEPDGQLRFFSRRESVKGGNPEHTLKIPHLTDKKLPQFAGNTYSVEVIHTGHNKQNVERHNVLSGILNSKVERAVETQKQEGPIRAVLLDVKGDQFKTYRQKLLHMKEVEKAFGNPDLLYTVTPHITKESIVNLIDSTQKQGREGVIITDLDTPEINNPRIKLKHFQTHNLRVKGMTQEVDIHGNLKPSMGALILEDKTGKEVGQVGSGFTKKDREDAWKNPQNWTGNLIQVRSMGVGKEDGRLRHPIYNGEADGEIDTV